jgi:hypothetical protein
MARACGADHAIKPQHTEHHAWNLNPSLVSDHKPNDSITIARFADNIDVHAYITTRADALTTTTGTCPTNSSSADTSRWYPAG